MCTIENTSDNNQPRPQLSKYMTITHVIGSDETSLHPLRAASYHPLSHRVFGGGYLTIDTCLSCDVEELPVPLYRDIAPNRKKILLLFFTDAANGRYAKFTSYAE